MGPGLRRLVESFASELEATIRAEVRAELRKEIEAEVAARLRAEIEAEVRASLAKEVLSRITDAVGAPGRRNKAPRAAAAPPVEARGAPRRTRPGKARTGAKKAKAAPAARSKPARARPKPSPAGTRKPARAPRARPAAAPPPRDAVLERRILDAVAAHPGLRMEALAEELAVASERLKPIVRQLVEGGALVKGGKARGTHYRVPRPSTAGPATAPPAAEVREPPTHLEVVSSLAPAPDEARPALVHDDERAEARGPAGADPQPEAPVVPAADATDEEVRPGEEPARAVVTRLRPRSGE